MGANIEYQPDFTMRGLNKPFALGATFQYDFLPEANYFNSNSLKADYFLHDNHSLFVSNTLTKSVLGEDSLLQQNSYASASNRSTNQNLNLNTSLGKVNGFITDSTLYDDNGRRTSYFVNMDGRQFLNLQGSIRRSYKKGKNSTYKGELRTNLSFNKNPNYINNVYNVSEVTSSSSKLSVDYAFKDLLTLRWEQGLVFFSSVQQGFKDSKLNSTTISTMFSGSVQFPKNVNWSTNITFNQARANHTEGVNFAIWNANLAYRFLKGNRVEVKFSALDLLHQNKAIVNSVSGNSQSFGYINVLQQYYMITLSYFPRKFGK